MNDELDEYQPLENYTDYINEMKEEFDNQKENCTSLYSDIKVLVSSIEKDYPDLNPNCFSDFFQIIEEYYSLFTNIDDILQHFSHLNEQCITHDKIILQREDLINKLKNENEILNQDKAFKDSSIAKLEEEVQLLSKDYIALYNSANVTSRSEGNELTPSQEEEKTKLLNAIKKLKEEKSAYNKEIIALKNTINTYDIEIKTKYVLKVEHERMLKEKRKELKEKQKVINQMEDTMEQLQKEIVNLCNLKDDLLTELEQKRDEIERLRTEETNEKPPLVHMPSTLDNLLLGEIESKDEDNENGVVLTDRSISDNGNNVTIPINLKITSSDVVNEMNNNNFKKLKEKPNQYQNTNTSRIKSIYNIINNPFDKKHMQSTRKVSDDYYKQFFFLTFQSIKLNSDNIEPFLSVNPEYLYKECKLQHIPFHKYESWLNKTIFNNTNRKEKKPKANSEYGNFLSFISSRLI